MLWTTLTLTGQLRHDLSFGYRKCSRPTTGVCLKLCSYARVSAFFVLVDHSRSALQSTTFPSIAISCHAAGRTRRALPARNSGSPRAGASDRHLKPSAERPLPFLRIAPTLDPPLSSSLQAPPFIPPSRLPSLHFLYLSISCNSRSRPLPECLQTIMVTMRYVRSPWAPWAP
jgi:hypothetical protein